MRAHPRSTQSGNYISTRSKETPAANIRSTHRSLFRTAVILRWSRYRRIGATLAICKNSKMLLNFSRALTCNIPFVHTWRQTDPVYVSRSNATHLLFYLLPTPPCLSLFLRCLCVLHPSGDQSEVLIPSAINFMNHAVTQKMLGQYETRVPLPSQGTIATSSLFERARISRAADCGSM
jgi:hypothetical protein